MIAMNATRSGYGSDNLAMIRGGLSSLTEEQRHREVDQLKVKVEGDGADIVQTELRLVCMSVGGEPNVSIRDCAYPADPT